MPVDLLKRFRPAATPGATDQAALPLNSLTNVEAYRDRRWMELFHDLGSYSYDRHIFLADSPPYVHRKGWEWTQTLWGLDQLGMIRPEHHALGVGAGRECVIFWLGDHLRHVVATDLYGNEHWTAEGGHEADAAVVADPQAFCPRPIDRAAIEFRYMDGTELDAFEADTFDISWSLSSIEHFGSHERASDAVREMARVVRSGGVVVIATEFLLLGDQSHAEYFNRQDFETFVIDASPDLALVGSMDWTLPPDEYLIDSVVLPQGADKTRRHVVLNDGHVQWTSILGFFRRR